MNEGGYTKIVDRKKDMIVVSGFKVFPNELEEVISMMPGVLECAAIGIPNEETGIFRYYCFYAWERQREFSEDATEEIFNDSIIWC